MHDLQKYLLLNGVDLDLLGLKYLVFDNAIVFFDSVSHRVVMDLRDLKNWDYILKGVNKLSTFEIKSNNSLVMQCIGAYDMYLFSIPEFDLLHYINVYHNKISSLESFKSLKLNNLKYLSLTENNLEDITEIKNIKMPFLEKLFFTLNSIQDFTPLLDCDFPNLDLLNTGNNPGTNSVSKEELQSKFPKAQIFNWSPNGQ